MFKHNIYYKYFNDAFASFISYIAMLISITIHTLDPHKNQFGMMFIFKHNYKHIFFSLVSIEGDQCFD